MLFYSASASSRPRGGFQPTPIKMQMSPQHGVHPGEFHLNAKQWRASGLCFQYTSKESKGGRRNDGD